MQRAERRAVGDRLVGRVGPLERRLGHQGHDGIDRRIDSLDAVEMRLDDLAGGKLPGPDQGGKRGRVLIMNGVRRVDLDGGHDRPPILSTCRQVESMLTGVGSSRSGCQGLSVVR
jgi:hypothetical protein